MALQEVSREKTAPGVETVTLEDPDPLGLGKPAQVTYTGGPRGGYPTKPKTVQKEATTRRVGEVPTLPAAQEQQIRQSVREELARKLPAKIGEGLQQERALLNQQTETYNRAVEDFNKKYGDRELTEAEYQQAQKDALRLETARVNIEEKASYLEGQEAAATRMAQLRSIEISEYAAGRMTTEKAISRGIIKPETAGERFAVGTQIIGERISQFFTGTTGRETLAYVGGEWRPTGKTVGYERSVYTPGQVGPTKREKQFMIAGMVKGAVTTPLGLVGMVAEPGKIPERVVGSLETVGRRAATEPELIGAEIIGGATAIGAVAVKTSPVVSKAVADVKMMKAAGHLSVSYAKYKWFPPLKIPLSEMPKTTQSTLLRLPKGLPSGLKQPPGRVIITPGKGDFGSIQKTFGPGFKTVTAKPWFGKGTPTTVQTKLLYVEELPKPTVTQLIGHHFGRLMRDQRGAVAVPSVSITKLVSRAQGVPSYAPTVTPTTALGVSSIPALAVGTGVITQVAPIQPVVTTPSVLAAAITRERTTSLRKAPTPATSRERGGVVESISGIAQKRAARTATLTAPISGFQTITSTKTVLRTKIIKPERLKEEPPPPTIWVPETPKTFTQEEAKQYRKAFEVWVRRKGKWVKISKKLPRRRALKLGKKYVTQTPARTFKLKRAGVTEAFDIPYEPTLEKFYAKGGSYIEKVKYAIDTAGEFRGITLKGIKAKKVKI